MATRSVTITGDLTWDPARPEHPIVPGGPPDYHPPPLNIWGPTDPRPTVPIYIPPNFISDGVPSHPIWLPVYIWGPGDPRPNPPIVIPPGYLGDGKPTHPIILPPLVIWGPGDPRPTPPIVLPPGSVDPGPPMVPAHPIHLPPPVSVAPPAGRIPIVAATEIPPGAMVLLWTAQYGYVLMPAPSMPEAAPK